MESEFRYSSECHAATTTLAADVLLQAIIGKRRVYQNAGES
jgi:hypothetical protein